MFFSRPCGFDYSGFARNVAENIYLDKQIAACLLKRAEIPRGLCLLLNNPDEI
jgi:hypothetical protein